MKYQLIDGEAMHAAYPNTFGLPSKEQLSEVRIGWFVKAGFEMEGWGTERMWVEVTSLDDGKFTGVLNNDPIFIPPALLKCGDLVVLEPCNVLSTLEPRPCQM